MKLILTLLGAALAATGLAVQDEPKSWNFDADQAGAISKGLSSEVGDWKVVADPSAPSKPNALAQLAKSASSTLKATSESAWRVYTRQLGLRQKARVKAVKAQRGFDAAIRVARGLAARG